ncbi:T9SS type A sorting domain-containing protein [Flavobacterium sediminilitoris]|uniref:T9SS type A sorting domain-containing protein n=1 Tax=Flavobacterium sediminilitoris TaxID=2024526 RepID=A0ABY4HL59_9FLAO|nr:MULTISPECIES: T9SS type A sorting domain-containing protein [Flavobacterium]UOX33308.1 T9SS type A sorting domain-containing protein [Flavobacterium sediminilitoris]
MNKKYVLFTILSGFFMCAQNVNLPDINFKTKLLTANQGNTIAKDLTGEWFKIDANDDGEIQVIEAEEVSYLNLNNSNISDLTGIENFISLTGLNCFTNELTSLNVSNLINLKTLHCGANQLTSLDVTGLINLKELSCSINQLVVLDVSSLSSLVALDCKNNPITSLDFSNLINLRKLNCSETQLTYLNLKNNNPSIIDVYSENTPNLAYICANEEDIAWIQNTVDSFGYTNCNINSYCDFTPGGTYYEITGNIKYDFNGNGCDVDDSLYPNLNFSIANGTNTGSFIANGSGNFNIPVDAGTHILTPNLENPSYFTISPVNITVDFPTQANPALKDFCIISNGVYSDVEAIIITRIAARPGFDAHYKISYRNKGTEVENGTITFTYDATVLDYVSTNPVFESQTVNTFTWNYSNLQPFETREIEVVLNVNSPMETPAINNGDILNYSAVISTSNTDETPNDNEFTLNQTVVGSYDPNDITCLEGETVAPDMIGEYVHYLIRFENTGTYSAENVVVKDMIDLSMFDLTTLVPLKGSHDYYTRIKDNKVEFIFENINLDFNDATNDGFVAFKIKTRSNLVVGDTFSNDANIYFDYNFPVTTNTYTTAIQALSVQDFDFGSKFTLYPNPVQDVLNFNSKENIAIQSVEIYNMLGQVVLTVPNATKSVDVSNLTKGNYFVKVNTEKGNSNTKFIKE